MVTYMDRGANRSTENLDKTVQGPDDYASMVEVLERRF